jgi:hypothetical protein
MKGRLMHRVLVLTWGGLVHLAAGLIMGRRYHLLMSPDGSAMLGRVAGRARAALLARGLAHDALDLVPDLRPVHHEWTTMLVNTSGIYGRLEKALARHFGIGRTEIGQRGYDRACWAQQSQWIGANLYSALVLDTISRRHATGVTIGGLGVDLAAILEIAAGRPGPAMGWLRRVLRYGVTAALSFGGLIVLTLYAMSRLRRHLPPPERVLAGVDFVLTERFVPMITDVLDDPGQLVFVFRSAALQRSWHHATEGYRWAIDGDGAFDLKGGLAAIGRFTADLWRLWRAFGGVAPVIFRHIAMFPYRKCRYRALANLYAFDHYLSGDSYNPQHILRTDEFRRSNMATVGLNYGLPLPSIVDANVRYVDYDIYLSPNSHIFRHYYAETWPPEMVIDKIGTFALTREQLARRDHPRDGSVIFFASPMAKEQEMFEHVLDFARRCPQRKVLVKIKAGSKRHGGCGYVLDAALPPNVVETEEDSYQLMLRSSYAVLGPGSTVAVEAAYLGVKTFIFDLEAPDKANYFRNFPEIIVDSGEVLAGRISSIDSGRTTYPWDRLGDLTDLGDAPMHDVVRRHLGLPPLAPAPLRVMGAAR